MQLALVLALALLAAPTAPPGHMMGHHMAGHHMTAHHMMGHHMMKRNPKAIQHHMMREAKPTPAPQE
ncbi:MAG: hypothetical protein M3Y18_02115 [Candidatus Eremiobacteraeota bacterium]|nr:hypothetical protein [Candidatus Eremiobacteraeota bacterium]